MTTSFQASHGLIIVQSRIAGPRGTRAVRLALDTGATSSTIRSAVLVALGYDPSLASDRIPMTTASGVEYVSRVTIEQITALGQSRESFAVIAHTLPPSALVDGLLGLDFFRGHCLNLDFRTGQILFE